LNNTKKIFMVVIIILVLAIGAYSLYPHSLEDTVSSADDLHVVYNFHDIDDGEPVLETTEYFFAKGSEEIEKVRDILSRYTYHHGLRILSYENDLELSKEGIFISLISGKNFFSSGGAGDIMMNSKVYKMDYWGSSRNRKLMEELSGILN
jgi:hypothetical protein